MAMAFSLAPRSCHESDGKGAEVGPGNPGGAGGPYPKLVPVLVRCLMRPTQKVTIEVPTDLLNRARRSTGEGITATVRRGLELVASRSAYEELRRLRGKV